MLYADPHEQNADIKQARFQQAYTVLAACLSVLLPPIITTGIDDVASTEHEAALGESLQSTAV